MDKNEEFKREIHSSQKMFQKKKVKTVEHKFCLKKDTHVYNNCFKLLLRAIINIIAEKW